jgi:hypothetical protein
MGINKWQDTASIMGAALHAAVQALLEMMHAQRRQSSRAASVKCYAATGADSDGDGDDDEERKKKGGKVGCALVGCKSRRRKLMLVRALVWPHCMQRCSSMHVVNRHFMTSALVWMGCGWFRSMSRHHVGPSFISPSSHLQAKSGGSRKSGAAAAGARQQLSGFEGCEPMFGHADIYPKYQAGKCQAWHSGEQQRQQLHAAVVCWGCRSRCCVCCASHGTEWSTVGAIDI